METKTRLKSILGLATIALLLSMEACDAANNPSALVGRWVVVSGDGKGDVMELLSDGTGISKIAAITWKTENGRFYLNLPGGLATSTNYKLQGSLLTFTNDEGEILTEFTKCKKDCKETAKEYAAEALKAKFAGVKKSSFTDSRDGKSYKTLKFGNQTWMAENLNYNANGSRCYDNDESNCQKYGRLYDWNTALNACPKGWHLPSNKEWGTLVDFAGGSDEAGNILKATSGWNNNGNGVDAVGFLALPGGYGDSSGSFRSVGSYGDWWSATEVYASNAYYRNMGYSDANVYSFNYDKSSLYSVRCVQD